MIDHSIEMDDLGHEPPMPELKLALAVVCNALFDCRRGVRRKYTHERQTSRNYHERQSDEARDFLLIRLNEEQNIWGQILRHYGLRPLTPARLALLVRERPTRGRSLRTELLAS